MLVLHGKRLTLLQCVTGNSSLGDATEVLNLILPNRLSAILVKSQITHNRLGHQSTLLTSDDGRAILTNLAR